MPQSGGSGLGPFGDALKFFIVGIGEQRGAVGERVTEASGTEIIRFADQHGGTKIGIAGEGGRGLKHAPADGQVLLLDLFLQVCSAIEHAR